ncbi:MAG: acetoacetate decarboxylase family protein [Dehalococcoidia bacterium]|nr:acetoacetate decarboxylase family protein [Dehalococcoidia bacterium]MBE0610753.1 acetoacetate decarboxylase family protein [Dehalococcoidia bacterium]
MPLVGTRSATDFASGPLVTAPATERWELPGAGILQLMYEIDAATMTSLLPPALHPTIPPTLVFTVTNVPESPVGPFVLAEVKVGSRSGARPRGLLVRGYCNSAAAIEALSSRWGYPLAHADCTFAKRYDRIEGTVSLTGQSILELTLLNPDPISGNDVQYLANLNVARMVRAGSEVARLVQVDPDYTFRSADRGKPQLGAFDPGAWGVPGASPSFPVSASYCGADISLPEIRYLADPAKDPLTAVERL